MKTRKQYMSGECSHREFYAQFVSDQTIQSVINTFGEKRIKESTDEHFNDIPLKSWDNMYIPMPLDKIEAATGRTTKWPSRGYSLSDKVCIAKEAAKQIKETPC